MKTAPVTMIQVALDFGHDAIPVGRVALRNHQIYFEYDRQFLARKLEISPFRLPLESGLKAFKPDLFQGLPGVFYDSLPDGWGRLLLDRALKAKGVDPAEISILDRLAHVGCSGMGALTYEPDYAESDTGQVLDLVEIANQAATILSGPVDTFFEQLLALNGSSAGARPKALIGVNFQDNIIIHGTEDVPSGYSHWLVKFPNLHDGRDAGAVEYVYGLMAKEAGVLMSDLHLFPAKRGPGFFASKRFDRNAERRCHMHSVCGLLHADFRYPSFDYKDMLKAALLLTKDMREVTKLYRLAVFNVLAHNRDDHSKNFSFLMNAEGVWQFAPAYDLTFSSGPGGEHSMLVAGEGRNPGVVQLCELAKQVGISESDAKAMICHTKSALAKWPTLAKQNGVSRQVTGYITKKITACA